MILLEVGDEEREEVEEGVAPNEIEAVFVVLLVLEFVEDGHLEGDCDGNKDLEEVFEGLAPGVSEAVGVLEGVREGVMEPVIVVVGDVVRVLEGVREMVELSLFEIVGLGVRVCEGETNGVIPKVGVLLGVRLPEGVLVEVVESEPEAVGLALST